jgi:hypothetical protein
MGQQEGDWTIKVCTCKGCGCAIVENCCWWRLRIQGQRWRWVASDDADGYKGQVLKEAAKKTHWVRRGCRQGRSQKGGTPGSVYFETAPQR